MLMNTAWRYFASVRMCVSENVLQRELQKNFNLGTYKKIIEGKRGMQNIYLQSKLLKYPSL